MGAIVSVALAFVFNMLLGGFRGSAEALYEGIIMLSAAALISWMIVWMISQKKLIRKNIEQKVDQHVEENHPLGIFFLVFLSVIREGIETVLFLHAAYLQASSAGAQLFGGALGISLAILISVLFFRGMGRLSMQRCFSVTSVLLVLFAAGLVAHGIHELQEAAVLPIYAEHIWDTNWLLNESGTVGGLMKGVFGYNGNPNLIEVLGYVLYLLGIGLVWTRMNRKEAYVK